ncbi:MAG: tetratricopeptide repeat protein, partial [Bacteroidota bacterium]
MGNNKTLHHDSGSPNGQRERINLLLQTSVDLAEHDCQRGMKAAREALRLSRRLDDPRMIIESLFRLENHYFHKEEYPRMLDALTQINVLLDQLPDAHDLRVRCCHRLGSLYLTLGDLPKGIEILSSAFDYLDRVDPGLAALILGTAADTYLQLGYYPRAFELLGQVEKIAEQHGIRRYQAHCMECTGRAFMALGEWDAALEKFRQAADLWRALEQPMAVGAALSNIARILSDRDNVAGALEVLASALALHREFGTQQHEAWCLLTMANILKQSDSDEALHQASQALAIFESIGDRQGRSVALADIGNLYMRGGAIPDALSHFLKALGLAEEIGYRPGEYEIHASLAAVYEQLGDAATSLEHYKSYVNLGGELQGQATRNALAMSSARAEIERAEKEKEMALLKNEQLQLEMDRKSKELTAMALRLVQNNELVESLRKEIGSSLKEHGDARTLARAMQKRIEESTRPEESWKI